MVTFKSCPRCRGDRVLDHDKHGWYLMCLMCGYVTDPLQDKSLHISERQQKSA